MAKKSYTKRIKITKNGKFLCRKPGVGHNKAKRNGGSTRSKRKMRSISIADYANVKDKLS